MEKMEAPVAIDREVLKALIKESVREVIREERFRVWQSAIPEVSDAEQAEIERELGTKPVPYDSSETVDMTAWLTDEA